MVCIHTLDCLTPDIFKDLNPCHLYFKPTETPPTADSKDCIGHVNHSTLIACTKH